MPTLSNIAEAALRKSKSRFDASIVVRDEKEARYDPLSGLTPELLRAYLDDWRRGWLPPLAVVMDEIQTRSSIVASVSGKAKRGVCRHGWKIITAEGLDTATQKQALAQKELLQNFFDQLIVTDALDRQQKGGVRMLLKHMMNAFGSRYSVHEILWRPDAPHGISAELRNVPLWFFESSTGSLRFLPEGTQSNQDNAVDLKPDEWFVNVMDGVMIAGASDFMAMNLVKQDELIMSQKYGFPIPYASVSDAPGSDAWRAAEAAMAALQGGDSVVKGTDGDLDSLELKTGSYNPHPGIIERLERMIAILWLGNDLSTISQGNSDSTGASLQGASEDDQSEDNAIACEEAIDTGITTAVLRYAFGDNVRPLAHLHIKGRNREALKDVLERFCKLSERQYPVTIGHVSSALALPLPADADPDTILQPPTTRLDQGQMPDQPQPEQEESAKQKADKDPDPKATKTQPVPNSRQPDPNTRSQLLTASIAQALGILPQYLPPELPEILDRLRARLQDDTATHATVAAEFEAAIEAAPELFGNMNHDALGEIVYASLSATAAQAIETTVETQPVPASRPIPANT